MDIDALPWQADWYRTKAQQAVLRPAGGFLPDDRDPTDSAVRGAKQ